MKITAQPDEAGMPIVEQSGLIFCSSVTGTLKHFNVDSVFDKSKPAWLPSDRNITPYEDIRGLYRCSYKMY